MTLFEKKKDYTLKDYIIFIFIFLSVMTILYAQTKLRKYILSCFKTENQDESNDSNEIQKSNIIEKKIN